MPPIYQLHHLNSPEISNYMKIRITNFLTQIGKGKLCLYIHFIIIFTNFIFKFIHYFVHIAPFVYMTLMFSMRMQRILQNGLNTRNIQNTTWRLTGTFLYQDGSLMEFTMLQCVRLTSKTIVAFPYRNYIMYCLPLLSD